MGWLKSNWLDALIFLLVAIIMAGVVFFLTGTNPLDAFNGNGGQNPAVSAPTTPQPSTSTPPAQTQSSNATPAAQPAQTQPSNATPTAQPAQTQPSNATPATQQPDKPTTQPAQQTTKPTPEPKPSSNPTPSQTTRTSKHTPKSQDTSAQPRQPDNDSTGEVTVVPLPLAPQADANPVPAPARVEPRLNIVSRPENTQPARPAQTSQPTPRPQTQPVQVRRAPDPGGSWRIAVGSFGQRENAERLAATLRSRGYPDSLAASGSNTRVWVGPYSSSSRARAVASTLGAYSPQVVRGGTSAEDTVVSSTPTPQATAPAAPRSGFLQAGAFRSRERAQAVADQVTGAGFNVSVVEAGSVYRVRVGPVDDVAAAIAALRARGISAVAAR